MRVIDTDVLPLMEVATEDAGTPDAKSEPAKDDKTGTATDGKTAAKADSKTDTKQVAKIADAKPEGKTDAKGQAAEKAGSDQGIPTRISSRSEHVFADVEVLEEDR